MSDPTPNADLLKQHVQFLRGVGPKRAEVLSKLKIFTASDLLFHFPLRYENFSGRCHISELELDQEGTVLATVDDIEQQKYGGRHVLYILLRQDNCFLRGIWFNQEYMTSKFRLGQTVQFRGKVTERGGRLQMTHPHVIWVEDVNEIQEEKWRPIYPLTDGINQRQMRRVVEGVVNEYTKHVEEAIPEELQAQWNICNIHKAIENIHSPANEDEMNEAKRRLIFQEFLILQLALSMRRYWVRQREIAPSIEMTPKIRARILGRMPFELRESQLTAFDEVANDLKNPFPMNRLLHGEVGSGKTVVAACSMMLATACGHQAIIMAPTEILAFQHYTTLQKLLVGSRVNIALCTGSLTTKQRNEMQTRVQQGDIQIVVGTTAVLSKKMEFNNLGLVIIDEQHKFGVRQRAMLKQSGFDPHYLIMTATPIPRTITMTLFGDLDVSTVARDASQSWNINTYLGSESNRERWWEFVRKKLREGRQAYVVAPFVENKAESSVQSVSELYESLSNGPLEAFRIGLVHGRQSSEEKQNSIQQFVAGQTQVLVATGVIEVGIDVPNASVMTIESAERFGLSQLHQLRGRVGRGKHPGYVCAFASNEESEDQKRLKAFEEIADGFELSRIDLEIRGPGNLLSTKQTGFPPLRIADIVRDADVLAEAQKAARIVIQDDPNLARPEFHRLRRLVNSRYSKVLDLGDVG